ncbi:MAG: Gfo/Idh/MocA family oxidoreductase [Candidatus Krumholzibacteria bacterium]|nr:Gfo/Idh/MocA family oxidoreductase [Candidatus Krumholzibacteria bacterium]
MSFRIGVLGAGTHGERYVRHALLDVPGMTVTALCRRTEELGRKLATQYGIRYHAEPDGLIKDPEVDGVVVCTPPSSHFELARAVLASGKPLLLEKPMTGLLTEAERLAELDTESPRPLMLAQPLRWNPVILKVRQLWSSLGRVHHIRLAQRLAPTTLEWQQNPDETVGGSVLLTGVHIFDLARFLSGREFMTVDSRQRQVLNPVVEDFFLARASLSDGIQVSLEVSKYTRSRACWLEAVGEEGQIMADYLDGGIILRQGRDEEKFDISAATPTLPLVLKDWLAAVRDGSPPPVTVKDGLATIRMAEACYRSAAAERQIDVGGI